MVINHDWLCWFLKGLIIPRKDHGVDVGTHSTWMFAFCFVAWLVDLLLEEMIGWPTDLGTWCDVSHWKGGHMRFHLDSSCWNRLAMAVSGFTVTSQDISDLVLVVNCSQFHSQLLCFAMLWHLLSMHFLFVGVYVCLWLHVILITFVVVLAVVRVLLPGGGSRSTGGSGNRMHISWTFRGSPRIFRAERLGKRSQLGVCFCDALIQGDRGPQGVARVKFLTQIGSRVSSAMFNS